jgi:serine phosphatase RsbU (regulator of sigma subunit)
MRLRDGIDAAQAVTDAASLHACKTVADLDRAFVRRLAELVPAADLALTTIEDDGSNLVRIASGAGCPWPTGAVADVDSWQPAALRRFPLRYRDYELGCLLLAGDCPPDTARLVGAVLSHYAVALVNLTLGEAEQQATEGYCASLQALEEGIVLFQESDPEAVTARLIGLATAMLQAPAGALYVLDEIGNPDSGLRLAQTLGMPEALLASFRGRDGSAWPRCLLDQPTSVADRASDPPLGGLEPGSVPQMLVNLASVPLRYHGVHAGVCVLFNVPGDARGTQRAIDRMHSLGQLSAALLHRIHLEAVSAHNRAIARELQIAEIIQQRLLPTKAPDLPHFQFAWRSIAAQRIGGDYLDLLTSAAGDLHAVIADASGHGINSALLTTSFRSTYRAETPRQEPAALARALNDQVWHEVGETGMFITAAMLRVDSRTQRMRLVNAGHCAVLHFRAASGAIELIASHGPPLGFVADARFDQDERQLARGDVLLLYTDGISEACNADLDMFGEERITGLLAAKARQPAAEILEALLGELQAFTGGTRYDDDVSASVIKVG